MGRPPKPPEERHERLVWDLVLYVLFEVARSRSRSGFWGRLQTAGYDLVPKPTTGFCARTHTHRGGASRRIDPPPQRGPRGNMLSWRNNQN